MLSKKAFSFYFCVLLSWRSFASDDGKMDLDEGQIFRGWGSSLAWEANVLYGNALGPSRVPNPKAQAKFLDMLYGDPQKQLSLGLNIARYNIGGGENPDPGHIKGLKHFHMPSHVQMEGFLDGHGQNYHWERDASQRKMLQEVRARGANIFEAFSNSPPYWMTKSGCVAGPVKTWDENLLPSQRKAFADYLADVVDHFKTAEGITFESIAPFNEPDGDWFMAGGPQEGTAIKARTQVQIIKYLNEDLKARGLSTMISASDANNVDIQTEYLNKFPQETLDAIGRVNIHQYDGTDMDALHKKTLELHMPLWNSEYGCCLKDQSDGTPRGQFFWLAATIRDGLRALGAEAWVLWQADWNMIDISKGEPKPLKQFFVMAQFSNFIRPGYTILNDWVGNSLGAYSRKDHRLVIVTFNQEAHERNYYDLSDFNLDQAQVHIYRTGLEIHQDLLREVGTLTSRSNLLDRPPFPSVTTYVIDGVEDGLNRK